MIGTLGTAPEFETLRNTKAGNYGGNMDVNEVTAGSTVYLPVFVDGALLHVGDVHAVQGDGEINVGGGIECRATVRLVADILPRPASMKWVRIEDDRYIMAVACGRSVEECFYSAAREILEWMVESYGFTVEEAYLLMGQVMEARCTQFVNPTRTYICKVPKAFLLPQDFR
jgi:amidase